VAKKWGKNGQGSHSTKSKRVGTRLQEYNEGRKYQGLCPALVLDNLPGPSESAKGRLQAKEPGSIGHHLKTTGAQIICTKAILYRKGNKRLLFKEPVKICL
jgi:hypothetical protein